ncbi:MAG: DUF4003 family protein [Clostridium sp.]
MDVELSSKVSVLTERFSDLKKSLRWDGEILNHFEALLYGTKEKELNKEKIKEIRTYIKRESKWNSSFRGDFVKIFSVILEDNNEYKEIFRSTKGIYDYLVKGGFLKGSKTAFAALMLSMRYKGEILDKKAEKLINIKNCIKDVCVKNKNDYLSYVNLATLNKEVDVIVKEFTEIKNILLQVRINYGGYIDSFIASLVVGEGDVEDRVEKALRLRGNLNSYIFKIPNKSYPLIGLATLLVKDEEEFAKEVGQVYNDLKCKKEYSSSIDSNVTLMISIALILNKYFEEIRADLIDINISEEINMLLSIEEYAVLSIASL